MSGMVDITEAVVGREEGPETGGVGNGPRNGGVRIVGVVRVVRHIGVVVRRRWLIGLEDEFPRVDTMWEFVSADFVQRSEYCEETLM